MTECNKSVYLANKSIDMIDAVNKGYADGYNKAIDDVLKLPKYKFYDTSKEFMNIRIDAISIEDILKLKGQNKCMI